MKIITIVAILLISTSLSAATKKIEVSESICKRTVSKIDNINKRMRTGYSVSQGERYKKELKQLKKVKYQCWKKGFKSK